MIKSLLIVLALSISTHPFKATIQKKGEYIHFHNIQENQTSVAHRSLFYLHINDKDTTVKVINSPFFRYGDVYSKELGRVFHSPTEIWNYIKLPHR